MQALLLAASALAAGGAVLLFAGLTRLAAVLYGPPDSFLLVGCAAGGSAGGALLAHRGGWHPAGRLLAVALGAALGALFAVLATWAFVGLAWLNLAPLNGALAYFAFAGIGATLAPPFAVLSRRPGLVAAVQLAGATLLAAVSGAIMDILGPVDTTLAAGTLLALAALLAAGPAWRARKALAGGGSGAAEDEEEEGLGGRGRTFALWGLLATGLLAGLFALPLSLASGGLTLDPLLVNSARSLFASVQDPAQRELVVYSRWDSGGRVDVTEPGATDEIKWVYLDGAATGVIPRAGTSGSGAQAARSDVGYVPYLLPGPKERVLIVGAGGGQEVLTALTGGSQEVVATEGHPGLRAALGRFSDYGGDLLTQPGVRLVPEDGRAYLRHSDERFDLIYLTLGTQGTAEPNGTVGGSYLHTLEALDEYVRHLSPEGRLVIKLRDEAELVRAFNTAFQVFTRRGASPLEAIRRLLAVNNAPAAQRAQAAQAGGDGEGEVALPLLIVRQTPFSEDEARQAFETLRQTPYPPLFVPHLEGLSPVLAAFAAEGLGPAAVEAQAPYQVRPATDGSPFFHNPRKGLPWDVLGTLLFLLSLTGGVALLSRRPGVETIEPEANVPDEAVAFLEDDVPWRFVGFVAATGGGCALVLYPLLQRLPLMVAWAGGEASLVLAGVTLGAALGGLLTLAVRPGQERPATGWATLAAALLSLAYLELLPMAEEATRGQPLALRAGVALLAVIPLGLCLGVPFPGAVRALEGAGAADGRAGQRAGRGAWATLLWAVGTLCLVCGALLA
ncbi:MAG TPA: class I SAM-dependent methyltransferase, partial [Chloroflexota bacterium]|nr:class I SAM-dependent methyltransferase [Chloroflexota bacterium]